MSKPVDAGEQPDDVVGHKTFDTGKRDEHGLPIYRHEPLTRAEGDAIWKACEEAKKRREETMPDERTALNALQEAYTRLKELGWREAIYCPKDGTNFKAIEAGSTGIHDCNYWGEWPNGGWHVFDEHDSYPSHPILFKLNPEDQAKEDERWKKARAALSEERK